MARIFKKKKNALILVLGIIIVFGYFIFEDFGARAQKQIKIFPTAFEGDPPNDEASWQNPQTVFVQDLRENAEFQEFNENNSAYPVEITTKNTIAKQKTAKISGFSGIFNVMWNSGLPSYSHYSRPKNLVKGMYNATQFWTPEAF